MSESRGIPDTNGSRSILAFADWDSGGWNIAYSDGSEQRGISREDFLSPGRFASYTMLLVGVPHLIGSDSATGQLYSQSQLDSWQPGCPVKVFDDMRVRLLNGGRKSNDAAAYRDLAAVDPSLVRNARWWSPTLNTTGRSPMEVRNAIRDDARERLMLERNTGYSEWGEWGTVRTLFHHMDAPTKECAEFFGISRKRNGWLKTNALSRARLMAVYVATCEKGGKVRRNDHGDFIGVRTVVDDVIGMTWSRVPNIMRSNIVHHGMRPMLRKKFPQLKAPKQEDELQRVAWYGSAEAHAYRQFVGEKLRSPEGKAVKREVKRVVREMVRLLRDAGVRAEAEQDKFFERVNLHSHASASSRIPADRVIFDSRLSGSNAIHGGGDATGT
jgi:hypothetical protein